MNVKTLLFTALILTMSTGVYAYRGGGCPYGSHYQGFMSDLTAEQQEKVTAVTDKHHEQLFALHKELRAKHEALEELFAATPADKAAIQALVKEINALRAEKFELNIGYRLEIQEIAGKPLPSKCAQGRGAGHGHWGHGHGKRCCPMGKPAPDCPRVAPKS